MSVVFIRPLRGGVDPVGKAFVSYAHEDSGAVKHGIVFPFLERGIPYFLDEQIVGGTPTLAALDEAMDLAACAVVALSPQSLASPWVWFETGVLFGRGKTIIPFVLDPAGQDEMISQLPDFIRQLQITSDVESLMGAVTDSLLDLGGLFEDLELNRRVISKLKQVELTLELTLDPELVVALDFGYLLIRFGSSNPTAGEEFADERQTIVKPMDAEEVRDADAGDVMRVEYVIPVHQQLGTTFKCFADVADVGLVPRTIEVLERQGMLDVRQSDSGEKQRVYFLLPLPERGIVDDGGVPNNFIYPV